MLEARSGAGAAAQTIAWARFRDLFRARGIRGAIQHLSVVALHRIHAAVERQSSGGRFGDPTVGKIELSELTIVSANRDAGVHYVAAPWAVLDWVQAALPRTKANWSFVDLGAGNGRAMLSAGRQAYAASSASNSRTNS